MKFNEVKTFVLELTYEEAHDLLDYFDDTINDADSSSELKIRAAQLHRYLKEAVRV